MERLLSALSRGEIRGVGCAQTGPLPSASFLSTSAMMVSVMSSLPPAAPMLPPDRIMALAMYVRSQHTE